MIVTHQVCYVGSCAELIEAGNSGPQQKLYNSHFLQTSGFKNQILEFTCTDFGFTARQFLQAVLEGKSEP